jgi:enoyl-[acyl-carrier protein] reductase I
MVAGRHMLPIDLSGKRAFVAGVADDGGFGFAIAKSLAEAGATICVGTWPPALGIFQTLLRRGKLDSSLRLSDGRKLDFECILPLDAEYDTTDDVPPEVRDSKRYKEQGDVTIQGCVERLRSTFGEHCLDVVVHSLANGAEVSKDLLATSRKGYLGAVSVSAYSMVSMLQRLGPLVRPGGAFLSLSYMASERVIPGYGGGMSSAKAALESDTRVLAWEAGRKWGHRVNCISAGPLASRAAAAIGRTPERSEGAAVHQESRTPERSEGAAASASRSKPFIEQMVDYVRAASPLPEALSAREVGAAAAFLCSPLASGITGCVIHVDKGYHAMGKGA